MALLRVSLKKAWAPGKVLMAALSPPIGIRQKLETKINAKNAIKADESAKGALDKLIEAYEKTVAGIKTTLEAEPAPEEDAPATKPVAEVVDAAAGDDHKDPAAVAEAKAKITEEAEKAQREEAKKDEDEDKVPKYVLTKYERIEFKDLLKAHTARLDALKACKAEIVKAPTPKAMTETPLEGDAMMIPKAMTETPLEGDA